MSNDHWLRKSKSRSKRRKWGIQAYVGLNGGGKSLAMVWDTLPSLDSGRPVLSTVRLLDFRNPRPCDDALCTDWNHDVHMAAHPGWIPFRSWEQLMEAKDCDVLMDEITGIASSRDSVTMPSPVADFLVQLRRRDVVLRWTSPNWKRADVIIREVTQAVTQCRGFLAVTDSASDRLWRPRRLFNWRTYDRGEFSEFTDGNRQHLKALVKDWHWLPGSLAIGAYDTLDPVLSVGTVTDSGRCLACGGRRSAPACTCEDHAPRRRAVSAAGPAKRVVRVPAVGGAVDLPRRVETFNGATVPAR